MGKVDYSSYQDVTSFDYPYRGNSHYKIPPFRLISFMYNLADLPLLVNNNQLQAGDYTWELYYKSGPADIQIPNMAADFWILVHTQQ